MRPRSLLVPVMSVLLSLASSFLTDVPSLDSRQVSCNESGVWGEWGQNCCGESACPPSASCTAGEEGCTSSKTTLSVTWTQITTTTTIPDHTSTQTIYSSGGTSELVSTGSFQSSTPEVTASSPNGTYPTSPCSSGTSVATSSQDSAPPSPPPGSSPSPPPSSPPSPPPTVSTTNTSSLVPCTDHSTPQTSSNMDSIATPMDTSKPANSDTTGPTSAATGTASKPSTTTNTDLMTSSSSSSSLAASSGHHSTTTSSITPFTGSSGAERPLVAIEAMAALAAVLSSVILQAVLL